MSYKEIQDLLLEEGAARFEDCSAWNTYVSSRKEVYAQLAGENRLECNMISEANRIMQGQQKSAEESGMHLRVGDICFMDFVSLAASKGKRSLSLRNDSSTVKTTQR